MRQVKFINKFNRKAKASEMRNVSGAWLAEPVEL
jgi:hypothetical protein